VYGFVSNPRRVGLNEGDDMDPVDPVVDLVRQAMGYGVMLGTEGRDQLMAKLRALPSDGSFPDALTSDAEGFVEMRNDLVERALGRS